MRKKLPRRSVRSLRHGYYGLASKLIKGILSLALLLGLSFGAALFYAYLRYSPAKNQVERLVVLPEDAANSSGDIVVASVDRVTNRVTTVILPENLLVPLARGRGIGRIGSLSGLVDEKEADRESLIKDSMQKALGWKMDLILYYNSWDRGIAEDVRELIRISLFDAVVKQQLNWWRVWSLNRSLTSPAFTQFDLPYALFSVRSVDVDGEEKEEWSVERWDAYIESEGLVTRLEQGRGVTVTVVNTTGTAGLGALVARIATNNGFDVVGVKSENDSGESGDSIVWQNPVLAKQYSESFGELFPEMNTLVVEGAVVERSDVVLYLGEKVSLRW